MDGMPILKDFRDEVKYVDELVYGPMMQPDHADPGGKEWVKLAGVLRKYDNGHPLTAGLRQAFESVLSFRPCDQKDIKKVLFNISQSVETAMACLRLHGKGEAVDTSYLLAHEWFNPVFNQVRQEDITQNNGANSMMRIEREFYSNRGEYPLNVGRMVNLWNPPGAFGRIAASQNISPMGHYLCESRGEILRVIDWAVMSGQDAWRRGLPEAMVKDLFFHLSDKTPAKRRYERLEYAVDETHQKAFKDAETPKQLPKLFP